MSASKLAQSSRSDGFFDSDSAYEDDSSFARKRNSRRRHRDRGRPVTAAEDFGYGGPSEQIPTMPGDLDSYMAKRDPDVGLGMGKVDYVDDGDDGRPMSAVGRYQDFELQEDEERPISAIGKYDDILLPEDRPLSSVGRYDDFTLSEGRPVSTMGKYEDFALPEDRPVSSVGNYQDFRIDDDQAPDIWRAEEGQEPLDRSLRLGSKSVGVTRASRRKHKPRDQLNVGYGGIDVDRSGNINQQRHFVNSRSSKTKPKDMLRLEGEQDLRRKQAEQSAASIPGQRTKVRAKDSLRLEGSQDFKRRDDSQQSTYKRPTKAGKPKDSLRLQDDGGDRETAFERDSLAVVDGGGKRASSRAKKKEDNLKLEGKVEDMRSTSHSHMGKKPLTSKVNKIKASDNLRVGEGQLEMTSTSRSEYKDVSSSKTNLRADPEWLRKQPQVTVVGGKAKQRR